MKFLLKLIVAVHTLLLFTISCSLNSGNQQPVRINLHENWYFNEADLELREPARVPGCVYTDLLANNKIEPPFYRNNEAELQWVEKKDWVYQTEFDIDMSVLAKEHIRINFKGLDTHAIVTLNGFLLFRADNMFREWSADCKGIMKYGPNVLKVQFHSPVKSDSLLAAKLDYKLPDERVFSRKAPYQYGWDWGPRFVTMGIWRPVILEAWNGAHLEDLQIYQDKITEKQADCRARFEISSSDSQRVNLRLKVADKIIDQTADLIPGMNIVDLKFKIIDPDLWWCNGLGKPNLYEITGKIRGRSDFNSIMRNIGVRTVQVVQQLDSVGKSFCIKLNGKEVFIKGANYIPQDSFLPRVTHERYDKLINSTTAANLNMLRIWGGGIYENDYFYELCDKAGIMVWQDFMFACAMYPGDSEFIDNVGQEARQNVKRLRNHPSLALWCGNNEVDEAWHNWGWQESFQYSPQIQKVIWQDYEKVFHKLLPDIIDELDPGRFYWPSSPSIGWGHKEALSEGDVHYWGVWWGKEPFEVYEKKVGRFMSEYGFQGMPSKSTINKFTLPKDRYLNSPVLKAHQKHPFGDENIQLYLKRNYRQPKDFGSFIYVSQLLQARGIGIALEAHRRNRPVCMGTLYWQLNDCWPVTSWSSLDYYNNWKALHYKVRDIFSNLVILPVIKDEIFKVYINSDMLVSRKCVLKLALSDFGGKLIYTKSVDTVVLPNTNQIYYQAPFKDILQAEAEGKVVLNICLFEDNLKIAERRYYFCKPLNLDLPKPIISTDIRKKKDRYVLTLSSSSLAKNVYLEVEGVEGRFSNNFFDLLAGETIQVEFITPHQIENFKDKVKIMSLRDSY